MIAVAFDVHSIAFLNNPAAAGLPPDAAGMGVISVTEKVVPIRHTFLVDHDYALMLLDGCRHLEGDIGLAESAVRWARQGWQEEWPHPTLSPSWFPICPDGAKVAR